MGRCERRGSSGGDWRGGGIGTSRGDRSGWKGSERGGSNSLGGGWEVEHVCIIRAKSSSPGGCCTVSAVRRGHWRHRRMCAGDPLGQQGPPAARLGFQFSSSGANVLVRPLVGRRHARKKAQAARGDLVDVPVSGSLVRARACRESGVGGPAAPGRRSGRASGRRRRRTISGFVHSFFADLVLNVRVERAAELADGGEVSSADQPFW